MYVVQTDCNVLSIDKFGHAGYWILLWSSKPSAFFLFSQDENLRIMCDTNQDVHNDTFLSSLNNKI